VAVASVMLACISADSKMVETSLGKHKASMKPLTAPASGCLRGRDGAVLQALAPDRGRGVAGLLMCCSQLRHTRLARRGSCKNISKMFRGHSSDGHRPAKNPFPPAQVKAMAQKVRSKRNAAPARSGSRRHLPGTHNRLVSECGKTVVGGSAGDSSPGSC